MIFGPNLGAHLEPQASYLGFPSRICHEGSSVGLKHSLILFFVAAWVADPLRETILCGGSRVCRSAIVDIGPKTISCMLSQP